MEEWSRCLGRLVRVGLACRPGPCPPRTRAWHAALVLAAAATAGAHPPAYSSHAVRSQHRRQPPTGLQLSYCLPPTRQVECAQRRVVLHLGPLPLVHGDLDLGRKAREDGEAWRGGKSGRQERGGRAAGAGDGGTLNPATPTGLPHEHTHAHTHVHTHIHSRGHPPTPAPTHTPHHHSPTHHTHTQHAPPHTQPTHHRLVVHAGGELLLLQHRDGGVALHHLRHHAAGCGEGAAGQGA